MVPLVDDLGAGPVRWLHREATDAVALEARIRKPGKAGADLRRADPPIAGDAGFLRSLLDCSADSVSVIDAQGNIRFMTRQGLHGFGEADLGTVIGRPWLSLWPAACGASLGSGFAEALAGRPARRDVHCRRGPNGESGWWEVTFSLDVNGPAGNRDARRVVAVTRDITERHAAITEARLLTRELDHRVRNMLSMVQAIVRVSAGVAVDTDSFVQSVEDRIAALARTHTLLIDDREDEVDLRDLIDAELAPFGKAGRNELAGSRITINETQAFALSLALHELTSNAVKYGSLSQPGGRVLVAWSVSSDGDLLINWQECGGPENCRQARSGFGSMLLETLLADQLTVRRTWHDKGVEATIRLSVARPPAAMPTDAAAPQAH